MAKQSLLLRMGSIVLMGALTGCNGGGGGDGESKSPSTSNENQSITGTAAIGVAISGGRVSAKCVNGSTSGTTEVNGTFKLSAPGIVAPCAIQVSFGNPEKKLHSVTNTIGNVNITPITELIAAKALGNSDLPSLFMSIRNDQLTQAAATLPVVRQQVTTMLQYEVSVTVPKEFDPINSQFQASVDGKPNGDAHDKILDDIKTTLESKKKDITHLVELAVSIPDGITAENNKAAYDRAIQPLNDLYTRFKDAQKIASSTPRITLGTQITIMQSIKRDTDTLIVPKCLSLTKQILAAGMDSINNGFIAFMAQQPTSSVSFFMDLGNDAIKVFQDDLPKKQLCNFSEM